MRKKLPTIHESAEELHRRMQSEKDYKKRQRPPAHGVLLCRAALSEGPLTCPKGTAVEALGPRSWRPRGDGHRDCVDLHADAARARLRQG